MHPPHLPYKSSSIRMRLMTTHVKNSIAYTAIALIAGISGALVSAAWIEPTLYRGQDFFLVNRNTQGIYSSETPDALLLRRFEYATVTLYDKNQKINDDYYGEQAKAGTALLLSSNGWGVMYLKNFKPAMQKNYDAVDYQGTLHTVDDFIIDDVHSLVYLKFSGNEFRVINFPEWSSIDSGMDIWAIDNGMWKKRVLGDDEKVVGSTYLATDIYSRKQILTNATEGSFIISNQGQFLGFVNSSKLLQSSWTVQYQLPSILATEQLTMPPVDWTGYFVERKEPDSAKPSSGFFVASTKNRSVEGVLVGDIVTAIEHEPSTQHAFYQQILSAPNTFVVTVWRKDTFFDILITK